MSPSQIRAFSGHCELETSCLVQLPALSSHLNATYVTVEAKKHIDSKGTEGKQRNPKANLAFLKDKQLCNAYYNSQRPSLIPRNPGGR